MGIFCQSKNIYMNLHTELFALIYNFLYIPIKIPIIQKDITMNNYTAIVEKCPDTGLYVGYVPGFPGAHSQAQTLDELKNNLQKVIEMLLQDGEPEMETEFVV
jgi:predicted RNase H-like HicB family nuclease